MKRIAYQLTHSTILAVVFLAFVVVAGAAPALAASGEPVVKASKTDRVEARVKALHARLKITQEQEESWGNVAQAMRDNAKTMEQLTRARAEGGKTMNAIEDLKSYAEIADAHADGLKQLIPAFEPLYASMSDAQKKSADRLFHRHSPVTHHKSKAKGK
jgi:periplasmic protein CpxP/Spy